MRILNFSVLLFFVIMLSSCQGKQKTADLRLSNYIFEDLGKMLSIRDTKTDEVIYAKENTETYYATTGYLKGVVDVNLEKGYASLIDEEAKIARYFVLIDNTENPTPPKGYEIFVHKAFIIGFYKASKGKTNINATPCSCIPVQIETSACTDGGEGASSATFKAFRKESGVVCSKSFYACCRDQSAISTK